MRFLRLGHATWRIARRMLAPETGSATGAAALQAERGEREKIKGSWEDKGERGKERKAFRSTSHSWICTYAERSKRGLKGGLERGIFTVFRSSLLSNTPCVVLVLFGQIHATLSDLVCLWTPFLLRKKYSGPAPVFFRGRRYEVLGATPPSGPLPLPPRATRLPKSTKPKTRLFRSF